MADPATWKASDDAVKAKLIAAITKALNDWDNWRYGDVMTIVGTLEYVPADWKITVDCMPNLLRSMAETFCSICGTTVCLEHCEENTTPRICKRCFASNLNDNENDDN